MDIVEVPLDQEPESTEVAIEPEVKEEKARGRGRPKGAPNKPKKEPQPKTREPSPASPVVAPKPKPKRKTAPVEKKEIKKKKRIVYESSESDEAHGPACDTRTNDMQQIAGEVLSLLSSQRANQREQRRNRYAGWFANTNM